MQIKISLKLLLFSLGLIGVLFYLMIIFLISNQSGRGFNMKPNSMMNSQIKSAMSYHTNVYQDTRENENFRKVLFTGPKSQLVVMSIPVGGEVGEEVHKYTEQTLFFLSGSGEGMLDDKKFPIVSGDVVVVTAGTKHNFWNTGSEALKIYTVYAPPNHIDGRIHHTKADADADLADEAIGESESLR